MKEIDKAFGHNKWVQAEQVRINLTWKIENEEDNNTTHGLPSAIDPTDIFDTEGREYRRVVEATTQWNRPELPNVPRVNADGTWRSTATEMLKVLNEIAPEESEEDAAAWHEVNGNGKGRGPGWFSYASALQWGKRQEQHW